MSERNAVVAFLVTVDFVNRVVGVDRVTRDGMLGLSGGFVGGADARVVEEAPWVGRGSVTAWARELVGYLLDACWMMGWLWWRWL